MNSVEINFSYPCLSTNPINHKYFYDFLRRKREVTAKLKRIDTSLIFHLLHCLHTYIFDSYAID